MKCYSTNNEDYNYTEFGDLLDGNDMEVGDTIYIGEAVHPDVSDLVNIDFLLEDIGQHAYDLVGEHADDYPNVSKEEINALKSTICDWLEKYAPPTFWTVKNVVEHVLTDDDFA